MNLAAIVGFPLVSFLMVKSSNCFEGSHFKIDCHRASVYSQKLDSTLLAGLGYLLFANIGKPACTL